MASDRIDVLDHGFVRLVEHMGSDLSIVRAARVSYTAARLAALELAAKWHDAELQRYSAIIADRRFSHEARSHAVIAADLHEASTRHIRALSALTPELPSEKENERG